MLGYHARTDADFRSGISKRTHLQGATGSAYFVCAGVGMRTGRRIYATRGSSPPVTPHAGVAAFFCKPLEQAVHPINMLLRIPGGELSGRRACWSVHAGSVEQALRRRGISPRIIALGTYCFSPIQEYHP